MRFTETRTFQAYDDIARAKALGQGCVLEQEELQGGRLAGKEEKEGELLETK